MSKTVCIYPEESGLKARRPSQAGERGLFLPTEMARADSDSYHHSVPGTFNSMTIVCVCVHMHAGDGSQALPMLGKPHLIFTRALALEAFPSK